MQAGGRSSQDKTGAFRALTRWQPSKPPQVLCPSPLGQLGSLATIIPNLQMWKQNRITPLVTWPSVKCVNPATLASTRNHVTR